MVNYKEILRLAAEGTSQRQIAASVRSSRNKVNEVLMAATHVSIWLGFFSFDKTKYRLPDTVKRLYRSRHTKTTGF